VGAGIKGFGLRAVPDVLPPGNDRYIRGKKLNYVHINEAPDPKNADLALYGLECYEQFTRTSTNAELKVNSPWYLLGIDALDAASHVLEHFNYTRNSQLASPEQLAELRAEARTVSSLISKSPAIHDSYFVGDRPATSDELSRTMDDHSNIFRCAVDYGCFWQERPEDTIALYRELMSSSVFAYLHQYLWRRPMERPRLVAWNDADQRNIPAVWGQFIRELENSSNVSLQLEAKAFAVADAPTDKQQAVAFTNFFDSLIAAGPTLVTNPVEVMYLEWRTGSLVPGDGPVTEIRESLRQLYRSKYQPKLGALDGEYWHHTLPSLKFAPVFGQQKAFLKDNIPFDPAEFNKLFVMRDYSPAQALEILPLIASYRSNLIAKNPNPTGAALGNLMIAKSLLGFLERQVNDVLKANPGPTVTSQAQKPAQSPKPAAVTHAATNAAPIITNVLTVDRFSPIPLQGLTTNKMGNIAILAHHLVENKLLLDCKYDSPIVTFDTNGHWNVRYATFPCLAVLDLNSMQWKVVACPETRDMAGSGYYHCSTLWRDALYTSRGNHIQKYDFETTAWKTLEVSDGGNAELFNVNDHLYGANDISVYEILDGGERTRLLASNRRNPPMSALDSEVLGTPTLFEGAGHSLRLATSTGIFSWTGADWRKDIADLHLAGLPSITTGGLLWIDMSQANGERLLRLGAESNALEFCLEDKHIARRPLPRPQPGENDSNHPKPKWTLPPKLFLGAMAQSWDQSILYLLADHAGKENIVDEKHNVIVGSKVVEQDGCHAELLSYSADMSLPQEVYLRFRSDDGAPPVSGYRAGGTSLFGMSSSSSAWMLFTGDYAVFGIENPMSMYMGRGGNLRTNGLQQGVWLLPVSTLNAAIAARKQEQTAEAKRAEADHTAAQSRILATYDLNHNGVIDQEEKENAMDDPDFIESELNIIDANHDGWLDLDELAYFDANHNKILDPKEQAGLEIAQHLMAQRLFKEFDANGDGVLSQQEFIIMVQDRARASGRMDGGLSWFMSADTNHDGVIDPDEFERFFKDRTSEALHRRTGMNTEGDDKARFKSALESYWQNPHGMVRQPGPRRFPPFGPGPRTNPPPNAVPGPTP
jgi:Ca2+-binding EF-hand superfamily protein